MLNVEIKEDNLEIVVAISNKIPEFHQPHGIIEYQKRLANVPSIILVAYIDNVPAGFKVGYEREGYFYSWMGAILPKFRRLGLASRLADQQENWAKEQGYSHVTFKTRNRLKSMLIFALNRGFNIISLEGKDDINESRIILRKMI